MVGWIAVRPLSFSRYLRGAISELFSFSVQTTRPNHADSIVRGVRMTSWIQVAVFFQFVLPFPLIAMEALSLIHI